jgi:hypothetical protein
MPPNFRPTFTYKLQGEIVSVRIRPYLIDVLEKLSYIYEIVIFTAG